MGFFGVIINEFYLLTIFAKRSVVDVRLGSKYVFEVYIRRANVPKNNISSLQI